MVIEEYPDDSTDAIEEKLSEIWHKLPVEHHQKYQERANAIARKNRTGLRRCNYMKKGKSRRYQNNKEDVKPQSNRVNLLKPKAFRVSSSTDDQCTEDGTDSLKQDDLEVRAEYDYSKAIKETMTYNSPDKNVKRKMARRKVNDDIMDFNDENELATGFLQDIMISDEKCMNSTTTDKEITFSSGDLVLNHGVLDVSDLDSYLTSEDCYFESCDVIGIQEQIEIMDEEQKERELKRLERNEKQRNRRKTRKKPIVRKQKKIIENDTNVDTNSLHSDTELDIQENCDIDNKNTHIQIEEGE